VSLNALLFSTAWQFFAWFHLLCFCAVPVLC
jgi:hypothetical protein